MCGCSRGNCDCIVWRRRCICWCEPVRVRPRPRPRPEKRSERIRCHCRLEGISLQLTTAQDKDLPARDPVVFNETLTDHSHFISYNNETGVIEVFKHGNYLIDWDISVEGSEEETCIRFGLEVNGEVKAASTLPVEVGQINGRALIHVDQIPTMIRLINETDETIQLSQCAPIANLRVVAIA